MKCPDCAYVHSSPQQIGRHRLKAHGVSGKHRAGARSGRGRVRCDLCKKWSKNALGHSMHMSHSHPEEFAALKGITVVPKGEIVVAAKKTKKENPDHGTAPTELYAYITGKIESLVHHVALEHDLPARQFASGFVEYFHRAASR